MDYELMMNGNVKIGQKAPDFEAVTTYGNRSLEDYKGKWLVLFSHPGDFTPVCTTEMIAFAKAYPYFKKMNTELLGLSIDSNSSHEALQMLPTTKNEAITCKKLFNLNFYPYEVQRVTYG